MNRPTTFYSDGEGRATAQYGSVRVPINAQIGYQLLSGEATASASA
jgi:hypothetical protein